MSEASVAIITGAGTGIGRSTAVELAGAGWRCAIVGRRRDKLDETAAAMRARNPNAELLILSVDVAAGDSAECISRECIARWGDRINALVNNAATLVSGPIDQMSDETLRTSLEVNAVAPARLVRSVWPRMKAAGGGRIINVSSMATVDPFPGLGAYGMSKSALEGLTRSINAEGKRFRILAFSLVLGAVETDMLRSFVSEKMLPPSKTMDPAAIGRVIAAIAGGERDADAGKPIILT